MLNNNKKYQIAEINFTVTRGGDEMAKLKLIDLDNNDAYYCVMWQEAIHTNGYQLLRAPNIISVELYDYNDKYNNYNLKALRLIEEGKHGLTEEEQELKFKKIISEVEKFSDEKLKNILLKLLTDIKVLFIHSPAAKQYHHNYRGGLVQHICECIDIAYALFDHVKDSIDKDLVIAGCITHDIGKTLEYQLDDETGKIQFNQQFQKDWVSHVHYGFSWANQHGFPKLAHIIASHHRLKEWGAIVEPQTDEAELVNYIDMISGRLGAINVKDIE